MAAFKQSYMAYGCFLGGVILIFIWAVLSKKLPFNTAITERFANPSPYTLNMYYADWCPHCTSAKPEFAKLGATMTIDGKQVVCNAIEAEKNPELVREKVNGYPTVRLYDPAGKMTEYEGERTEAGFRSFVKRILGGSQ